MPNVPTTNLNAYYASTTAGEVINPTPIDPAIQDLAQTINDNYALFNNLITALELPIPDQSIVTRHLRNLAVTNPKLAALAVTADKIADGSITLTKLADLVVTAAKIADGTIIEQKLANLSVSRRTIMNGAVGANQLDPSILNPISDAGVQVKFAQIDEQFSKFVKYKKVYLSEQNLPGDGLFRTISSVFPTVTLAEVQTLNPSATLSNSADWYVIQKLINTSPLYTAIVVDGKYVVDVELRVFRTHLSIEGKTEEFFQWSLQQTSANTRLIAAKGSYLSFKNMLLSGLYQGATKTSHGIEIVGDNDGVSQSDHFIFSNLYIQNFGNNGVHCDTSHFILNKFENIITYNCFNNGIYLHHTSNTQMNGIIFYNVSTYNNGLQYSGGSYTKITPPPLDRGHGISISGTGISIIGGDSSENSGSGLNIQDGYFTEGFFMAARYFENNGLANVYNEGRKAFNFSGNYRYPALSLYGNVLNKYPYQVLKDDIEYEVLELTRYTNKPIQTYTHTSNKVVYCTSITSNAFVSAGHGLVNGDRMYPILNYDVGPAYPPSLFPSGIYNRGEAGLFVVNATTNNFQLSESSGGSPITITGGGDVYDLNTFHFEVNPSAVTYVTNLYVLKPRKIRAKIRGRFLAEGAPAYILPVVSGVGATPNWVQIGQSIFGYPSNQIAGDIYVDLDVKIDGTLGTNKVVVSVTGNTINTKGLANELKTEEINKTHVYMYPPADGFDGIDFTQCYFANGTTVDIYLD